MLPSRLQSPRREPPRLLYFSRRTCLKTGSARVQLTARVSLLLFKMVELAVWLLSRLLF
jgi:hypothetical protein